MHDYIYDDSDIVEGDILEAQLSTTSHYTKGRLYIVKRVTRDQTIKTVRDDKDSVSNGWHISHFRKVKTLPGLSHVLGDVVIYIGDDQGKAKGSNTVGNVTRAYGARRNPDHIYWSKGNNYTRHSEEFKVVCIRNDINNNGPTS